MLLSYTEMTNNLTEKRKLGNLGEEITCRFLMKHGFSVVERNYLKKCGEIDIVAKRNSSLHFIEVKSVSCETIPSVSDETDAAHYRPEDNVHQWKLERISKTIQLYLLERNVSDETTWQFDVVTVYIDKKNLKSKVKILENIVI